MMSGQAQASVTGPVQAGPIQAGPIQAGPVQAGPVHAGPVHAGPAPGGPVQAGPVHAGPIQAGPVQAGHMQTGPVQAASDSGGGLIIADDLPDGLVIADHAGRVTVFNRAAGRLTGIPPAHAVGQDVRHILPLQDADGRNWWAYARPYHGLSTRTRHPERSLFLPCGTELLVTIGYVRDPRQDARGGWHRDPGAVRRVVINIRGAQQRARIERSRADLVSTVAHELRSP